MNGNKRNHDKETLNISSRRTSTSSSCNSPNNCDDSGHYSSSNVSEFSTNLVNTNISNSTEDEAGASAEYGRFQQILRERDQSLFLAVQDNRKLRSELERLTKSEKWYKNEWRTQKHSRLEVLEKYYLNERKSVLEIRRLEEECIRLSGLCEELRKKILTDKETEEAVRELRELKRSRVPPDTNSNEFELEKLKRIIEDQESLIDVFRKQKQTLLSDLKKISSESDEKILVLDKSSAELLDENRRITRKCVELVKDRRSLEEEVGKKSQEVGDVREELNKKCREIANLRKKIEEAELKDIARNFETDSFEIAQKTEKITLLEAEIANFQKIQERYEEQMREIKNIRFQLKEQVFEIENLKSQNADFNQLSEKYSEICKICEKTSFDLDMRAVEVEKLKFEKASYQRELFQLQDGIKKRRNEHKIEILQSLLSQQSAKVQRINDEQANWQSLLENLKEAEMMPIQTSQVSSLCAQIDEMESERRKDNEILSELVNERKSLQSQISRLKALNESAVMEFNEIFCRERENFKNLEKSHRSQIEFLEVEKKTAQDELMKLRSQPVWQEISPPAETHEVQKLKILNKVIETEHIKKIARFEIHIRTLLGNVNSYRKSLETSEKKRAILLEKYEKLRENAADTSSSCGKCEDVERVRQASDELTRQLEDYKEMYQGSLENVKDLKHQLETARNQFVDIACYKRLNSDMKISLTNLMDDYKTLIQPQNISTTKQKSSSNEAILDLINRSNNFVPNFHTLSDSIDGLKGDVKKLLQTYPAGRMSPTRKMSLMDELRAANIAGADSS